jgi:hypothetical protein
MRSKDVSAALTCALIRVAPRLPYIAACFFGITLLIAVLRGGAAAGGSKNQGWEPLDFMLSGTEALIFSAVIALPLVVIGTLIYIGVLFGYCLISQNKNG